ncbi:TonB-dependent receptor [Thalassotalea fonticola]|uniref:TonB-dependent receptor n=1 Tax=Thalassotalea fonticola TaxID=3065649 RepID=A0ABZ0GRB3_9GAMM|nr:TonB-dependent receptor [Colwelliaceae bacterium S1-1]
MKLNQITKALLLAAVAGTTSQAYAQEAEQQANQLKIETIEVTARKYRESSQEVPISMTVVTSDALDNIAAFDFSDITKLAPGLEVNGNDPISGTVKMRGVGKDAFTGNMDDSVVIFIDGVAQTSVGAAFGSLSDIARVEVLRGPQGTLYGKNAPAGAINITTKSIDMYELGGGFQTSHAYYDETSTYGTNNKAHINVPLIDGTLGMRVSAFYDDSDGYIHNEFLDEPANDYKRQGARVKVQYIPNDNIDISFIGNYNDSYNGRVFSYIPGFGPDFISKQDPKNVFGMIHTPKSETFASLYPDGAPAVGSPEDYSIYVDQNAFSNTILKDGQINFNLDLEDHSITSISYYQDVRTQFVSDQNGTPIDDELLDINTKQTLLSQELRLSNIDNEVFDYLLGFYYAKSTTKGPGGKTTSSYINGMQLGQFAVGDLTTDVFGESSTESYGYFGHLTYNIDDQWSVSGGIRYNDESKTFESSLGINGTAYTFPNPMMPNGEFPLSVTSDAAPKDKDNYYNVSGSFKLQYKQDADIMYYLALDTAYRSGGFNLNAVDPLEELRTFGAEDSYSTEIGMKSSLLDNRLQFNVAYYYQVFEDYQFGDTMRTDNLSYVFSDLESATPVSSLTANQSHVLNAEEAVSTGIETDFIYLLSENFVITGALTYIDTEYKEFMGFCDNGAEPTDHLYCDFSGESIGSNFGLAPASWVGNIQPLYYTNVDAWGVKLSNSVQINYDDVKEVNADYHLGFEPLNGNWSLKFFIKNLLDRKPGEVSSRLVGGSSDTYAYDMIAPRQVGMTFGYTF